MAVYLDSGDAIVFRATPFSAARVQGIGFRHEQQPWVDTVKLLLASIVPVAWAVP
jgi:hypothetical protein